MVYTMVYTTSCTHILQGVPRHLNTAEHADTELAGMLHDLMHTQFAALEAVGDGPLPGGADAGSPAQSECALRAYGRWGTGCR